MKKTSSNNSQKDRSDDMKPEYCFDYSHARPNRFAKRIDDKRVVVVLDPDVSEVFTTPESVNEALRDIISHKAS